jgi:hypothetical protein
MRYTMTVAVVLALVFFSSPGVAFETNSARIMPTGKVLLHQADKLVGEISSEAPLPINTDLTCNGKCAIKMDGLYLVADDKASLSVDAKTGTNHVALQFTRGNFYFALSKLPYPLSLKTPEGDFSIDQALLNASGDGGMLKGYVTVDNEQTVIGVFEGGSMIISTEYGSSQISSGKQMTIAAQNTAGDPEIDPQGAASGGKDVIPKTPAKAKKLSPVVIGAIGAGAVGAVALAAGGSGGGGSSATSPSEPQ